MSEFVDFLTIPVSELLEDKKEVIEVSSSELISNVLILFNQHFISSLPVYQDTSEISSSSSSSSSSMITTTTATATETETYTSTSENDKIISTVSSFASTSTSMNTSNPTINTFPTPSSNRNYLGIISIIDILVYINRSQKHTGENSEDILNQPIRKAIGATMESSNLFIITDKTSLCSVIDKMCQGLLSLFLSISFFFSHFLTFLTKL